MGQVIIAALSCRHSCVGKTGEGAKVGDRKRRDWNEPSDAVDHPRESESSGSRGWGRVDVD